MRKSFSNICFSFSSLKTPFINYKKESQKLVTLNLNSSKTLKNHYIRYLHLDKIMKNEKENSIMMKENMFLKEKLLKEVCSHNKIELNEEFCEFLFKISSKEDYFHKFLSELYPKHVILYLSDEQISLQLLIKLIIVLSKNSIKNEELAIEIINRIEKYSEKEINFSYIFFKKIAHFIMILYKNYSNLDNFQRFTEIIDNFTLKNINKFDGESLSMLIYILSKERQGENVINQGFLNNIVINLDKKDLKTVKLPNLIRAIYNIISFEKIFEKEEFLKKFLRHINSNFNIIHLKAFDISLVGSILNKLQYFDQNLLGDELKDLSINFWMVLQKKIKDNSQAFSYEITQNQSKKKIITHLLTGIYSVYEILEQSPHNISKVLIFFENILVQYKFESREDVDFFKYSVFYFLKMSQGSIDFWGKTEENFKIMFKFMDLFDISFLTSSFKTNLPFTLNFWKQLESKLFEILKELESNPNLVSKFENSLKNIVYILCYHKKCSKKFWKYILALIKNRNLRWDSEIHLSMVNYLKSVIYIEDDFFLEFLNNEEVLKKNDIKKIALNLISFIEYGRFSDDDYQRSLQLLKEKVKNKLQETYFQKEIDKIYWMNNILLFWQLCWIVNKLKFKEFYEINSAIPDFLDKIDTIKHYPSNDALIKFIWTLFKTNALKNKGYLEKIESILIKKLPQFNTSMLSALCYEFGINYSGSSFFWFSMLKEIERKKFQMNIEQKNRCFSGFVRNQEKINFFEKIYDVFGEELIDFNDLSQINAPKLLEHLEIAAKKDSSFAAVFIQLKSFLSRQELYD